MPSQRTLIVVPLLLILCITVADIISPAAIHLGPLLVVAPAMASSFAGPRRTAAVAGLAVVAQIFISQLRSSLNTSNHLAQTAALILVSAVVVLLGQVRERRATELARVRTVSDAVQQVLLRPPPRRVGSLELSWAYQAAADEARVGGDFYDAVRTPHGARLLIGDIRGKGLEAVDRAALLLGAFRAAAHRNLELPALAEHLDNVLSWNAGPAGSTDPGAEGVAGAGADAGAEGGEDFATALLVDIPDHRPQAAVLSCGHPPPLCRHSGTTESLESARPAPPLGLAALSPEAGVPQTFPFDAGDVLLLYTDGVVEARGADGSFYPLADRLAESPELPEPSESPASPQSPEIRESPEGLIQYVLADLADHTGGELSDDAALLAVRRDAPGPGGAHQEEPTARR